MAGKGLPPRAKHRGHGGECHHETDERHEMADDCAAFRRPTCPRRRTSEGMPHAETLNLSFRGLPRNLARTLGSSRGDKSSKTLPYRADRGPRFSGENAPSDKTAWRSPRMSLICTTVYIPSARSPFGFTHLPRRLVHVRRTGNAAYQAIRRHDRPGSPGCPPPLGVRFLSTLAAGGD